MDIEILGYDDSRTLEKKRKQILSVSRKSFIEIGIDQTSMKIIADNSGITRRSLYNYYDSKDHIAVDVQILNLKEIRFYQTWGCILFYRELPVILDRIHEITERAIGEYRHHYVFLNRFDSYFKGDFPDIKYKSFVRKDIYGIFSVNVEDIDQTEFRSEWIQANLLLAYVQRLAIRSMSIDLNYSDIKDEITLLCKFIDTGSDRSVRALLSESVV